MKEKRNSKVIKMPEGEVGELYYIVSEEEFKLITNRK